MKDYNSCQLRKKKFSIDIQLLSYSFLIRLINQTFNLHSNFTLIAQASSSYKCNFPITDDFDIDGCIMNSLDENNDEKKQQSILEFIACKYPRTKAQIEYEFDGWCVYEDDSTNLNDKDDDFELIQVLDDSILVTIKPKGNRQETFLQKATGKDTIFNNSKKSKNFFSFRLVT